MPRVRRRSWYVRAWIVDVAQAIIVSLVLQSIEFPTRRGVKGSERLFAPSVIGNEIVVISVSDGAGLHLQWAIIPMELASLLLLY